MPPSEATESEELKKAAEAVHKICGALVIRQFDCVGSEIHIKVVAPYIRESAIQACDLRSAIYTMLGYVQAMATASHDLKVSSERLENVYFPRIERALDKFMLSSAMEKVE